MKYRIYPHQLQFKYPFKIAHTTRSYTDGAYLDISDGEFVGRGEIVFPPYYPETLISFQAFMEKVELPEDIASLDIKVYAEKINASLPGNQFAKAALDIAIHNLKVQHLNTSIQEFYRIEGPNKPTSYTIGISTNAEMEEKLKNSTSFEYIKLKVNEAEMERIITCYLSYSDKPFVVDANQGFKNKEVALVWCVELNKKGVAYFEQPFQKEDLVTHAWLTERSPIPIIADESFQTIEDVSRIKDSFHGVNIKLMKCGGIYAAYTCFKKAKEYNLKTVLGCMSESSVAVNAAYNFSPLADWTDLDGPFLLK